ncbi:Basic secretory protease [Bienertia sinuspersici]
MAHKINQLTTTLLLILAFTLAISREILAVDYTVTNNATSTNGGMVFANEIGEDYARQTLTSATNFIWQILQENTEIDRKSIDQVTLTIVPSLPPQIVALTSNNQIQYSAESITSSDDIKTGLKAGYIVNGWAKPGDGDKWDAGYSVTARFLDYCESLMDGFVAQLNKKMRDGYSDSYFEDLLAS